MNFQFNSYYLPYDIEATLLSNPLVKCRVSYCKGLLKCCLVVAQVCFAPLLVFDSGYYQFRVLMLFFRVSFPLYLSRSATIWNLTVLATLKGTGPTCEHHIITLDWNGFNALRLAGGGLYRSFAPAGSYLDFLREHLESCSRIYVAKYKRCIVVLYYLYNARGGG